MNNEKNVLVSIVTVCYNSSATIEDTIKSVVGQTYQNWEHIIIDGGSTDSTLDIVKSYEDAYKGRLRVYQGPDKGIYDAMNKGINYSKGTIIGIINSDDWYAVDALEHIVGKYQEQSSEEVIITGGLNRVDNGKIRYTQLHSSISTDALKKGMALQHPAVFVAKKVYDRIGCFDLSFPHIADYDFIWKCYADGGVKFLFVKEVVSFMRDGGVTDRLSYKHIKSRATERYRLRKRYLPKHEAFTTSLVFFIKEMTSQFLKKVVGKETMRKLHAALR